VPLVVGLTGFNAAGKGEVAARLAARGFRVHSLSDVVREEAARQGLAAEREHLIRIGNELRERFGAGVLAERILDRLGTRDAVDSIRSPAEVRVLRRRPDFVLVGIDAPVELRFRRSLARGRAGDPRTIEEFLRREAEENTAVAHAQQLEATFRLSDRLLANDGDLAALRARVDALVDDLAGACNNMGASQGDGGS